MNKIYNQKITACDTAIEDDYNATSFCNDGECGPEEPATKTLYQKKKKQRGAPVFDVAVI